MSHDGFKTTWKPFFWLLLFRDVSLRAIGTWFSVFRPCIIYLKIFVLTCFLWSWDISGWTIFHISSIKNWFKAKHVWIWCFSPVKRVSLELGKINFWFSIAFPHLKEPLEGRWDWYFFVSKTLGGGFKYWFIYLQPYLGKWSQFEFWICFNWIGFFFTKSLTIWIHGVFSLGKALVDFRPNGIPRGQGPFKLLDVFF